MVMKGWQFPCILAAVVVARLFLRHELPPFPAEKAVLDISENVLTRFEEDFSSFKNSSPAPTSGGHSADAVPPKQDFSYLADYVYSEVPPEKKPSDVVLESLKDIPVGSPIEEIERASEAFGLDFTFMKAVARIESGFDPKQHTGSYVGLYQLSNFEFNRYGSGDITDARSNAIAAAYKFVTEAILFEIDTHTSATVYDRYLIHQQGSQGAAEHVSHPERIAWQSMCATMEGIEKGEKWCKRAIWKNTLPSVRDTWKSVDRLTSGAFVEMWQERLDHFYARYAQADAPLPAVATRPPDSAPTPESALAAASPATPAKKALGKHALAVAKTRHNVRTARALSATASSSKTAESGTAGKPASGWKPARAAVPSSAENKTKKQAHGTVTLAQKLVPGALPRQQ
jgi:hypothetical protein